MKTFLKKNKKILGALCAFIVLVLPALLFAVEPGAGDTIKNPLQVGTIPELITIIVNAMKNIGYFVIVFFIIYSGFSFVMARGDDKAITDAKNMFLWTVVGAAVLLGAQILSDVIKNTVTQVGQTRNDVPIIQHDVV
jgi:hypothetical protein